MIGIGIRVGIDTVSGYYPSSLAGALASWHSPESEFGAGGWVGSGATLTSAALPTIGTRNGRRVLVFNGSTQYLTASFTLNQPSEVWLAARFVGAYSSAVALAAGGSVSGQVRRSADAQLELASTSLRQANVGSSLTDRWLVIGARFNSPTSAAWENGQELTLTPSADTGATAAAGLTLGCRIASGTPGLFAACEIGEVVTTSRILTEAERTALVGYLSWVL